MSIIERAIDISTELQEYVNQVNSGQTPAIEKELDRAEQALKSLWGQIDQVDEFSGQLFAEVLTTAGEALGILQTWNHSHVEQKNQEMLNQVEAQIQAFANKAKTFAEFKAKTAPLLDRAKREHPTISKQVPISVEKATLQFWQRQIDQLRLSGNTVEDFEQILPLYKEVRHHAPNSQAYEQLKGIVERIIEKQQQNEDGVTKTDEAITSIEADLNNEESFATLVAQVPNLKSQIKDQLTEEKIGRKLPPAILRFAVVEWEVETHHIIDALKAIFEPIQKSVAMGTAEAMRNRLTESVPSPKAPEIVEDDVEIMNESPSLSSIPSSDLGNLYREIKRAGPKHAIRTYYQSISKERRDAIRKELKKLPQLKNRSPEWIKEHALDDVKLLKKGVKNAILKKHQGLGKELKNKVKEHFVGFDQNPREDIALLADAMKHFSRK